jgi:hypothetical protein
MKNILSSILVAALVTSVSLAQNPAGSESQNTGVRIAPDTILRVELAKSIDAKKAKVGDEVIGKTMDDFLSGKNDVLAPKGSRVLAHVAEVSPRQGESASTLGIAFDKMVLKNGTDVPLKASIQAIGRPGSNVGAVNEPMSESGGGAARPSMSAPGRDSYGGSMPNQGGSTPGSASTTGTAANPETVNGQLTPNAQGVVGMSGVSLSSGAAQDSLITSPKHNVKLDSGTQMILRVIP